MRNDVEPVLAALLTHLTASAQISFTATATKDSDTLTAVSGTDGMFTGLPVFGEGVPRGATIASIDAGAGTVTLDQKATQDAADADYVTGFQTVGRRAKFWGDVQAQPALFIRHTGDDDDWAQTIFSKTTIEVEVWVYSRAGENPDIPPDTALNNLVRCIRESLAPDNPATGRFTLGGTVDWCRIEGHSDFDPGDIDAQAKAVLPIRITLP